MKNGEQPINPIDYDYAQFHGYSLVGLTKREYFAAMAMQGLLSSCDGNIQGMEPNESTIEYFSKLSIKAADELLKALES